MSSNPPPVLTEQERQEAIAECMREIIHLQQHIVDCERNKMPVTRAATMLNVQRMALAGFTAEPLAMTEKHEISNMAATGLYLRAWPTDRARNQVEGYTVKLFTQLPVSLIPAKVSCDGFNPKELEGARGLGQCEGWNSSIDEMKRLCGVSE